MVRISKQVTGVVEHAITSEVSSETIHPFRSSYRGLLLCPYGYDGFYDGISGTSKTSLYRYSGRALMRDAKHTQGPWQIEGNQEEPMTYTLTNIEDIETMGEVKANARLMETAPELLSALELVLGDNKLMNAMNRIQAQAIMDAVSKARGGR